MESLQSAHTALLLHLAPTWRRRLLRYVVTAFALGLLCNATYAGGRVALVIGNAAYTNEKPLANPLRDADLIGSTLADLFGRNNVRVVKNADRARLFEEIERFRQQASGADAAVFYFSGHGMQDEGRRNYLIPVDARISSDASLRAHGVPTDELLTAMGQATPRVGLIILDACRDSPYTKGTKSGTKGLARMEPGVDELLIAYATRDGKVAQDGTDFSPYAKALSRHLQRAREVPIRILFDDIADDVRTQTARLPEPQRPSTYGDLRATTYLLGRPQAIARSGPPQLSAEPPSPAPEPPANPDAGSAPRFIWPMSRIELLSEFSNGTKGIDIAGRIGDPVHSASDGTVVYAGTGLRGYGELVIVKHDHETLLAYAHNSSVLVKEGHAVKQGQLIARLGNSDSNRPKLHFEIRIQGKPVDPLQYLPPRP